MRRVLFVLLSMTFLFHSMVVIGEEVIVRSASMNKNIKAEVVLPRQYSAQTSERFPVMYLLHGYGDTFKQWITKKPSLQALATKYKMIIVCPDGSFSWYLDSPVQSNLKYDTHVSSEVVSFVDANYRTIASRSGRAITGLSMGGHGASYLALRHKDVYGAFGAMSGGLDYADSGLSNFWAGWNLPNLLGVWNYDLWYPYTAIGQLDRDIQDNDYKIVIHCGTSDFFLNVNRKFRDKLVAKGITHSYTESPGQHDWAYWIPVVEDHIKFFNQFFGNGTYDEVLTDYCVPMGYSYNQNALDQYVQEIGLTVNGDRMVLHSQSATGTFSTLNVLPETVVPAGATVNIDWKDHKTGESSTAYCRLFIYLDKNQDFSFSSDECLLALGSANVGSNTVVANNNTNIMLPATMNYGKTRIRLFYEGSYGSIPVDGCAPTARRVYDIPLSIKSPAAVEEVNINNSFLKFDRSNGLLTMDDCVSNVSIYSVSGALIGRSNEKSFSISGWPKGIYIVKVMNNDAQTNTMILY